LSISQSGNFAEDLQEKPFFWGSFCAHIYSQQYAELDLDGGSLGPRLGGRPPCVDTKCLVWG